MSDEGFSHPLAPQPWMDQATCAHVDPDLWFPTKSKDHSTSRRAMRLCHLCPVESECLEYALTDPRLEGIWGGLSYQQRRRILRRRTENGQ